MNYDPNMVTCGKMAKQKVRLVFAQWEYRREMIVEIGGNCLGFSVIDSAVESAFDDLENDEIVLAKDNGDKLSCENDGNDSDWLKDMLILAEIISIKEKP